MLYKTSNYEIEYNNNVSVIDVLKEYYRHYFYNRLKKHILRYKQELNISDDELTYSFILEVLSTMLFNHNFKNNEVIFSKNSPFSSNKLTKFISAAHLTMSKSQRKYIQQLFPLISKKYKKYYKILSALYSNTKLNIDISKLSLSNKYEINLTKDDRFNYLTFTMGKVTNTISIPNVLFNNLVKMYNVNTLNTFNTDEILDDKVISYIYILFERYNIFSSGNIQSSIIPSFKLLLKQYLNIKIELFGSSINSSNYKFGSFFYDIDKYFGSLGNFFNMNIISGYYEANPPFDKKIIYNFFNKLLIFFKTASVKKKPLLFVIILPVSCKVTKILAQFNNSLVVKKYFVKKEKFPYLRYNRRYTRSIVSPIVNTNIIIIYNNYIAPYVKNNITNFDQILYQWIDKKEYKAVE